MDISVKTPEEFSSGVFLYLFRSAQWHFAASISVLGFFLLFLVLHFWSISFFFCLLFGYDNKKRQERNDGRNNIGF